jgi:hypothetical protein
LAIWLHSLSKQMNASDKTDLIIETNLTIEMRKYHEPYQHSDIRNRQ